jgi:hypothetical protein
MREIKSLGKFSTPRALRSVQGFMEQERFFSYGKPDNKLTPYDWLGPRRPPMSACVAMRHFIVIQTTLAKMRQNHSDRLRMKTYLHDTVLVEQP